EEILRLRAQKSEFKTELSRLLELKNVEEIRKKVNVLWELQEIDDKHHANIVLDARITPPKAVTKRQQLFNQPGKAPQSTTTTTSEEPKKPQATESKEKPKGGIMI